jgi:hypothetical protein
LSGAASARTALFDYGRGRSAIVILLSQAARMRLFALFVLLTASAISAQPAGYQFSLSPPVAIAGGDVDLRIDSETGCYGGNTFEVVRRAATVIVTNSLSDTSPCAPAWQTPRFVNLGSFEAGQYEVVIVTCVNSPTNPCSTWATLPLTVYRENEPLAVPMLSFATSMGLLVLVAAAGLLAPATA